MDQRELTKKDAQGEDRFVIVLVMHLNDADNLVQEMRVFKEIIIEWHRARQKAAYEVKFLALADPKYHQAIEEFAELSHSNEVELKPIFQSTQLSLSLRNQAGEVVRERAFEKTKDASGILGRWFARGKQPKG
jgi:hypothetical protein